MRADGPVTGGELLEEIENIESLMIDSNIQLGRTMPNRMRRDGYIPSPRSSYNLIPADNNNDSCKKSLLVLVFRNNQVRERLLEASRHVNQLCSNTKSIVIWAAQWDASAWVDLGSDFNKVNVKLKLFGHPAVQL